MTTPAHERPRVVVGVDGSEGSKQALRWAAYVATTAGADIEAVTAWDFPLGYGGEPCRRTGAWHRTPKTT